MSILRYICSDEEIRELAMSDMAKWRRYPGPNLPACFFTSGIEAIRLGLLTEEDTKLFKNEMALWLAHEATRKRPTPRNTVTQIMKKINEYGEEYSAAWSKDMARLHARKDFDLINELRTWLAEESEKPPRQ